jgi:hypothetical protein
MPMPDRDSNGVDILDRFLAFKYRFMQFSVTEDVFNQVVEHIREVRKERDEARREVCLWQGLDTGQKSEDVAKIRGWDCFEKPKTEQQKAMDRLAELDEELGLH